MKADLIQIKWPETHLTAIEMKTTSDWVNAEAFEDFEKTFTLSLSKLETFFQELAELSCIFIADFIKMSKIFHFLFLNA